MTENKTIIEELVNHYNDYGYAVKDGANVLVSEEGTRIEIEPLFENNDNTGIIIVSDGVAIVTIQYDDKDFVTKVNEVLLSEFNQ